MTGMLESTNIRYEIIKEWANKSQEEKNIRINKLIDEVLSGDFVYDIIEQKEYEAKIIAEMILRNS